MGLSRAPLQSGSARPLPSQAFLHPFGGTPASLCLVMPKTQFRPYSRGEARPREGVHMDQSDDKWFLVTDTQLKKLFASKRIRRLTSEYLTVDSVDKDYWRKLLKKECSKLEPMAHWLIQNYPTFHISYEPGSKIYPYPISVYGIRGLYSVTTASLTRKAPAMAENATVVTSRRAPVLAGLKSAAARPWV